MTDPATTSREADRNPDSNEPPTGPKPRPHTSLRRKKTRKQVKPPKRARITSPIDSNAAPNLEGSIDDFKCLIGIRHRDNQDKLTYEVTGIKRCLGVIVATRNLVLRNGRLSTAGDPSTYHARDVAIMTAEYDALNGVAPRHLCNLTFAKDTTDNGYYADPTTTLDDQNTSDDCYQPLSDSTLRELLNYTKLGDALCDFALRAGQANVDVSSFFWCGGPFF